MTNTDALQLAEAAVDRLCEAHDLPIYRDKIHVGVARWKGRNGLCKYQKRLDKKRFGEKMGSQTRRAGNHAIIINERILEDGNRDGFIETVQHELAHAACYEEYADYPSRMSSHGKAWKQMARRLGCDPSACNNRRDRSDDFEYYIGCPECGEEYGRTKRSKIIQRPFNRKCGSCGHSPLSSYEDDQTPPEAGGVVAVTSIPWDDKQEWLEGDQKLSQ